MHIYNKYSSNLYKKIFDFYSDKEICIKEFCEYLLGYIIIFSILYLTLRIIDCTNIYITSIIDQDNIDKIVTNFSNRIQFKNWQSVLELIVDSIYFSIITFSTIGYGDIYPISITGKITVLSEVIGMFFLMYIGLNIVIGNEENKNKGKSEKNDINEEDKNKAKLNKSKKRYKV